MEQQQQQLTILDSWLQEMEARIAEWSPVVNNMHQLGGQLAQLKTFEEELQGKQDHVNNLHNMVIVIDDTNGEKGTSSYVIWLRSCPLNLKAP